MSYWIERLGFWGYMRQFPLNPITIVGGVIVIGILVLFINAYIRKSRAENAVGDNRKTAVMTFHKIKVGNNDYGDNIRIMECNGEKARWFFLRPAVPAIYLNPGSNVLELYTEWARGSQHIKGHKSEVTQIVVKADGSGQYSLEYNIPENCYIFQKSEDA